MKGLYLERNKENGLNEFKFIETVSIGDFYYFILKLKHFNKTKLWAI